MGIYCEIDNLRPLVEGREETPSLFVLKAPRKGRPCYAVYWGLFSSYDEAQAALASLPSALRSEGQRPIPVSRILR